MKLFLAIDVPDRVSALQALRRIQMFSFGGGLCSCTRFWIGELLSNWDAIPSAEFLDDEIDRVIERRGK